MKWYYLFSLIILVVFSCSKDEEVKDECLDEVFIGEYYLLQSSRDIFPYHEVDTLVFEDSLQKEVRFYVQQFSDSITTNTIPEKCDLNPEETINNIFYTDRISYFFRNDSLDLTFYITIYSLRFDTVKVTDNLLLRMIGRDEISLLLNLRTPVENTKTAKTTNNSYSWSESLTILGKTFYGVYKSDIYDKSKAWMFFNFTYGIVALRDLSRHTWVYKKTINKPLDPETF